MKSKSEIAAELHCQPWLVSPMVHREFARAIAGAEPKRVETALDWYTKTSEGVAVIPVRGMLWRGCGRRRENVVF